MKNRIHKSFLGMVLGVAAFLASAGAFADEWPLVPGNFWDVTGVEIKDGGGLQYATFLATEWRANQEFAKSQGWIKDYMILANSYPRQGEPDLYLISITEQIASGAESQKRQAAYMAWRKKTLAQMQTESGNRAAFRDVLSDALLQELKFRN
jgi:hypothetical protein